MTHEIPGTYLPKQLLVFIWISNLTGHPAFSSGNPSWWGYVSLRALPPMWLRLVTMEAAQEWSPGKKFLQEGRTPGFPSWFCHWRAVWVWACLHLSCRLQNLQLTVFFWCLASAWLWSILLSINPGTPVLLRALLPLLNSPAHGLPSPAATPPTLGWGS